MDLSSRLPAPCLVAGADACYDPGSDRLFGAVAVLSFPALELCERRIGVRSHPFPYIPGLLAVREAPVIASAFRRLRIKPDLLFVDGQGIAHPSRFGLACHLGILLDVPAIGCAKSRFVGQHRGVGSRRGSWAWLLDKGERIGMVLRTRSGVKPLYVSPGHRIGMEQARRITLAACRGLRLPEPLRQAHIAAGQARQGLSL